MCDTAGSAGNSYSGGRDSSAAPAAEKIGLAKSMHDVGIRRPLPSIVGGLVFWLLMCVFVMAAFNILGLQSISDADLPP